MTDFSSEPVPSVGKEERNWMPIVAAIAVVLLITGIAVVSMNRNSEENNATNLVAPINAPLDPYAANLPLTNITMSESTNLAGGKLTYLDGHIANKGKRTVTSVTVQVIFRDFSHQVARNETQSIKLIRMREPYVDVEPVSAAPLKPGDEQDFRLIFDAISQEWDGAYPEIRILHAEAK